MRKIFYVKDKNVENVSHLSFKDKDYKICER